MERIILIGSGGHAKSVIDSVSDDEFEVCGFIDEFYTGERIGKKILGHAISDIPNYTEYKYFIAMGNIPARKRWYEELQRLNLQTVNIIDKTAVISNTAKIGNGNFIGKYAIINADAKIGDNNIINTKALIEHECVVGSHTHLSTNSAINGNVVVEDCVFLGSCAVCKEQIKIGKGAVIGAGSVVIRDVNANKVLVGVPCHAIKDV